MICKGFIKPDDLCIVDMEGKQLSGKRKRTSEVLLHLAIMKERPEVKSVVHCHPPHATAFAVAREPIPQCVLPESKSSWATCRSPIRNSRRTGLRRHDHPVRQEGERHHSGQSRHGQLWRDGRKGLLVDRNPRRLLPHSHAGQGLGRVEYLGEQKSRELLDLKTKWGFTDARLAPGMENCDICANDVFRDSWQASGVERKYFDAPPPATSGKATAATAAPAPASQEQLVKMITEQVLAALAAK